MARPKKLYGAQPGTTDTTLYTVTAPVQYTIVKEILVTNVTSAQATLDISLVDSGGSVADSNKIGKGLSFAPNSITSISIAQVLDVGGFISAKQGTSAALTVRISGIEVT